MQSLRQKPNRRASTQVTNRTRKNIRLVKTTHKHLRPEVISRVARLEIQARQIVEGFLSGGHRSPYFGQSVEFVQHREYVPGDDVRRIDWKVWSKTDKVYVKLYEEDTNLRTTLLVDLSESMQFGSGAGRSPHGLATKYDYACTSAATLAYLLLRQQDSVGLVAFDEAIRTQVPPHTKRSHLHDILLALEAEEPKQKTDIFDVLRHVAEAQGRRGMIVVISDLLVPRPGLFKGLKLLRHRGHDVLVFHVLDDEELDFNFAGTTKFEGMEELGDILCDPRSLRDGYLAAMHTYLDELRRFCAQQTIDYRTIRTSEHIDAVLLQYMHHRIGMVRH